MMVNDACLYNSNNDIDQRIICSTVFKTMWRAYGKTLGIWSTLIYKRCIIHIYVGLQEGHNGKLVSYMNNHRRSPVSCTPNRGTKHLIIEGHLPVSKTSLWSNPQWKISKPSWLLAGGFNPSEEYEFVSWHYEIPNIWKIIKFHGSSHHQPVILGFTCGHFVGMLHSTNLWRKSAFCTAYPVKKKGSFNSPCSETFQYHIANKISLFVLIVPSLWYSYCRHMFMFLMYNFKSFPVHFSKLMTHIPYGFLKWCISHVKSWQTMVLPKGEWPWNIPWRTILNDHEISHVSM